MHDGELDGVPLMSLTYWFERFEIVKTIYEEKVKRLMFIDGSWRGRMIPRE